MHLNTTISDDQQTTIDNLTTQVKHLAKELKEVKQTVLRLSLLQKKANKTKALLPPVSTPSAKKCNGVLSTPSPEQATKQDTAKTQRTRTQLNKARALVFKQQVSFGLLKGQSYGRVVQRLAHQKKVLRYLNWLVQKLPQSDKFVMFLASQGFPKTTH